MKNEIPKEVTEMWQEQVTSRNTSISIKDLLGKSFKPMQKTYSSKGMKKAEIVDFLVDQTEKELFAKRDETFRNVLYGECKTDKEILEVISRFIKWVDTEKRTA